MQRDPIPIPDPVTIDDLSRLAARASGVIAELRKRMLLPEARKNPPTLSSEKLASICGISKGQMNYRIKNGAPPGKVAPRGGRREFTLEEVQQWAVTERADYKRPEGAKAVTIGVAFFKGGVTKTTTTMTLAQGLSLLGHRVLNIDMDPQGSLTTLHGLLPDSEIEDDATLGPLFNGDQDDVRYAIRQTYWPGIDLIPAASAMFSAEFTLPAQQMRDRNFEFWDVLNKGLDAVRNDYDVILIDTPPSLSYMTINAFYAADGIIVPMTASMLDMASSAQFWGLFSDLAASIAKKQSVPKQYEFVNVLLSKINNADTTTRAVRDWISTVYGGKVMPVEIPMTAVVGSAASEFATVFDIVRYDGDLRTYKRAREAYEALALTVEESIRIIWSKKEGS
jgi:chromosome partitioning protein